MIEILRRFGPAATKMWKTDYFNVRTPAVLYISSESTDAPDWAECILSDGSFKEERKCVINTSGSPFFPGDTKGYSLPPYEKRPSALSLSPAFYENEVAAVVYDPQKAPPNKELYVIPDAWRLFQEPEGLLGFVSALRGRVGNLPMIYAPGVMLPNRIPFLVYAGIDLLDNTLANLYSHKGRMLLPEGYTVLCEGICHCEYCKKGDITGHNNLISSEQMEFTRMAVENGTLRELAEIRSPTSAELVSSLRIMDNSFYGYQEAGLPVNGEKLRAYTQQSLTRPDIVRFQRRLEERYMPPERKILLLLPCSARKPYSTSRSHRRFAEAIESSGMKGAVHEVIVTSPMGIVPRELEMYYPASAYDIPVTGDWSHEEKQISLSLLKQLIEVGNYDDVVVHLAYDFVAEDIDGAVTVRNGRPTSGESLSNLTKTLRDMRKDRRVQGRGEYARKNMLARAAFQFGREAAEELMEEAVVKGRYPFLKIIGPDGKQRGMLTDRGMISLTMEGGKYLLAAGAYTVEIQNFPLTGSVFAVGIDSATDDIRIGDEVVVAHKGEIRGVGAALMNNRDMEEGKRGVAVRVRHHA